MNGLERYLGVLHGERVDHLPRTPILMQYAAEHIGSNYGAFAADYRVLVAANEACARDFGMDQLSCISDPYRETHGFGADVRYVPDGVPRCSPPLADSRDLSDLAVPDPTAGRMGDRVAALKRYRHRDGGRYSLLGWIEGPAAEAADLRGPAAFLMDLVDAPAFAATLMDRCVEVGIAFAQAQVDAGADTIGIGDAIASQVSPTVYAELIQPREALLIDAVKELGVFVKLHICGNITHLLPNIAELNIDILDLDHTVDPVAAREAVGTQVTISGNLDPTAAVRGGTPESIRAAILSIYEAVGNPYMVNAGCEIPSGTPPENLRALCRRVAFRP